MRRILKFLRSPAKDQLLLTKTLLLLGLIRLAISVLPFRLLDWFLQRLSRPADRGRTETEDIGRIAWAVATVCRCIPRATCLTQALTAQFLLVRQGCASRLQIGVTKSIDGRLEAHAWVEYNNQVVVGDTTDLPRYKRLFVGGCTKP